MKKFLKKRVLYPFVGLATFIFAFVMFFVNSPNVYADTSYTYSVSDINFKTASSDGYFTISKENGSYDGKTGKISYYMAADSYLSFTFTPTNKIITSVSTFNFYGEYDIDNYGTMAAKSVTYSVFFGGYTSESANITSEYTFNVDQDQLNARKPGSITFIIAANEELQLRVGGSFVFNAKDANVDVNFDAQGGTGGTSTIKATPGSAMPSITLPTKTGYTFDGYYTETNGGGTKYYNADGTSANNCPSTGLNLYAKWVAKQYTVTLNKQEGTGGSNSVTATYNSAMPSMTRPTRTGYTFGGYYTGTNGGGTQYYNANGGSARNWDKTSATTLYAKWTANQYTVTLDKQEGTGGSNSVTATYNSAMPSMTKPTRTGYTFGGYYTGTNGSGTQYYNANGGSTKNWDKTSATTLYAKWTANQYTVTFNNQNGTGGSNSVTATYDSAMPSATMPTKIGYIFAGYYDNTSGGTQYYTATGETAKNWDKAEATTLYARWTFNPDELIGLINDIGDVNYPNSRESLFKAEEVYNGLEATDQTTFQTTYSNDYKTLTDARIEYDSQKNVKVQGVIDAINAIGEVTYPNTTVKEALLNAEELYDELAPEEQNSTTIPNYSTLTDARESYNTQRTSKVNEVIVAIDAISEPFDENRETQITNARTLFNALDLDEQNDTWVTNLADLTNAEAADIVADMIEALTPADTQEYRDAVSAARTAYTNLTDSQKSYISVSILQELVDNETAITVMDKINDIGNVQYTNASKALIYDANQAYEALTEDQKELVVNYSTLTQANTDYDKVDESVDKVNLIKYESNGDLIFDDENKTLIYDAKETYDLLTDYQKEIYPEDILQKLLDALAVYNALDKIDKIGDVSYTDGYINQVTDAMNVYNDLTDSQKELISELALKDLNDNETVLDALKQVHDIDKSTTPSEYKEKLDDAKTVYENLTADQKTLIGDNIKDLNDREKTNEVVQNIDAIKDENSLEYSDSNKKAITDARKLYENLTEDQKKILPSKILKILTDDETTIAVLDKIYEIGKVSYNTESEDKIAEAREAYELLAEDQKKLVDTKDYSVLTTKEEKFDSITKTAIGWGVYLIILSSIALCTGIFFIIFLLRKKDEDDENNNIQKPKTQKASATVLPLVILSSYFARGPYLAFYIIISLAVAVWIAVLVIFILKKKKDSPVMEASIGTEVETTVDDTNDLEEDVTGEADNMMSDENAEASIEIDTVTKKHEGSK